MGQRNSLKAQFLKIFGVFAVLFCVGLGVLQAQFFNLENEDNVTPIKNAGAGKSKGAVRISVTELPETPEETAELDKNYQAILATLKDNRIKEGMAMLSGYDVITKQKFLNRLRKEDFGDQRAPNAVENTVENPLQEQAPSESPQENTLDSPLENLIPKAEEALAPSAYENTDN